MEFSCGKSALQGVVKNLLSIVNPKDTRPELHSLKLVAEPGDDGEPGTLVVRATNYAQDVRARVTAEVTTPGVAVVGAKVFSDALQSMSSEKVRFAAEGENQLRLRGTTEDFNLFTINPEVYPNEPELGKATLLVGVGELNSGFFRANIASSQDTEKRPTLASVRVMLEKDGLGLYATDSYRLTYQHLPAKLSNNFGDMLGTEFMLPRKSCEDLRKWLTSPKENVFLSLTMLEKEVAAGQKESTPVKAAFWDEHMCFFSNLVEGKYPKVEDHANATISRDHKVIWTVGKEKLLEVLRRAGVIDHLGVITFKADTITMAAKSKTVGEMEEALPAGDNYVYDKETLGESCAIGINIGFLADGLDVVPGDSLKLCILEPLKPILILGGTTDAKKPGQNPYYILMPVRLP